MTKQLTLPAIPLPPKPEPLVLDGDSSDFDFVVDGRPWPMPKAQAPEQPQHWARRALERFM
jgi:hypothetical protein